MQEKLKEAMKCSDEWDLKFNIKKTALVRFFKKGHAPPSFDYKMQGDIILVSHTTRDLGVHFSYDMSWSHHISIIIASARSSQEIILLH